MPGEYSFTKLVVGETRAEVGGGKQSSSVPSVKPAGRPEYKAMYAVVLTHDLGGVKGSGAGPWFGVVTIFAVRGHNVWRRRDATALGTWTTRFASYLSSRRAASAMSKSSASARADRVPNVKRLQSSLGGGSMVMRRFGPMDGDCDSSSDAVSVLEAQWLMR
jgi:hypothetical protein